MTEHSDKLYEITGTIEKAVLWRSMPECAGRIIVFIRNDTDKLHSLAEFEVITTRDTVRYLVETQIKSDNNTPTNNFWAALQATSDYYTFDALYDFVSAVVASDKLAEAIPQNMWRLNLLEDGEILGSKSNPVDRLAKNRDLIFAIGQLSEDSRKKLSRSLVRTKATDKERLQKAYRSLQNLYKYGSRDMLKALDLNTVQELFSASQKNEKKKKKEKPESTGGTPEVSEEVDATPIRPKELDRIVSNAVVFGDEEAQENIRDLLDELSKHYDTETEENDDAIPTIGGIFGDRSIMLESHQTDLRKLVGKFCTTTVWGGIMETDETVLKDAISADINEIQTFAPDDRKGKKKAEEFIPGQRVYFIKNNFIYPGTYVGKRYGWHEVLSIIGEKQVASFKLHKVYGTYGDAEKILNIEYRKQCRKRYGHAPKEIREYVEEEIKTIRLKQKGNDFIPDEDLF